MYKQDQIWTAIREKLITSPPPQKRVIPRHGSHDGTLGQVHKMERGVKKVSDNLGSWTLEVDNQIDDRIGRHRKGREVTASWSYGDSGG